MSRARWIITVGLALALAGLLAWQQHRERLMADCLAGGRTWNGPQSRCEPARMGPILRRALDRS